MDIQEAIEAPRWAVVGANVHVEARLPEPVRRALEDRGHKVVVERTQFATCHVVVVDPVTGARLGGAESRTDSVALGY